MNTEVIQQGTKVFDFRSSEAKCIQVDKNDNLAPPSVRRTRANTAPEPVRPVAENAPCGRRFPKPNPAMVMANLANLDNRAHRSGSRVGRRTLSNADKRHEYKNPSEHDIPMQYRRPIKKGQAALAKVMADKVIAEIDNIVPDNDGPHKNANERGFPKPNPAMTKRNLARPMRDSEVYKNGKERGFPKPDPAMKKRNLTLLPFQDMVVPGIGLTRSPSLSNPERRRNANERDFPKPDPSMKKRNLALQPNQDMIVPGVGLKLGLTRSPSLSNPEQYRNVSERGFPKPNPANTRQNLALIYQDTVVTSGVRLTRKSSCTSVRSQRFNTLGRSRANTAAAGLPKPITLGRSRANTAAARLPQPRPETDALLVSYSKGSCQKPETAARFRSLS